MINPKFVTAVENACRSILADLIVRDGWRGDANVQGKLEILESVKSNKNNDKTLRKIKENIEFSELLNEYRDNRVAGMNTPGLLIDRMSILICKAFLSVDAEKKRTDEQIADIGTALQESSLSKHYLLEKEQVSSGDRVDDDEKSLAEVIIDLHFSNIAMWVNQDLLYTSAPESASCDRLREYLIFFKRSNELRNQSIAQIDRIVTKQRDM